MIDEQQYKKMTDLLSDDVFWSEIDPFHYHQRGNRSPIYFGKYKKSEEFSSQSTVLLAIHAISLMVAPVKIPVQRFMSWNTFPEFAKNRIMNQLDLETEAFELGLQCFSNALIPDRRVKEFIQAAEYYEIPSGQSPETKSDRLLNIFDKNCVKVCLAPMAFSGTASIALATQGNFIGAFLCAGTGAEICLMFIGTVSLGDLMVD